MLNIFWTLQGRPFLQEVHDWAVGHEERYAGSSQATAALMNTHKNTQVALGGKVRETDWHRHDVRLYTKVVEG